MLEIIIITIISFAFSFGVVKPLVERYRSKRKANQLVLSSPIQTNDSKLESERKGAEFEKYIVHKFDRKYFTILEWRSDKYYDGFYAESNLNPDLELEYNSFDSKRTFSVECKFRQYIYKGGITIAKHNQLTHYRDYEIKKNLKVFIALGVGGTPSTPKEIFVVPLSKIDNNFISYEKLKPFKKAASSQFFYDTKKEILR